METHKKIIYALYAIIMFAAMSYWFSRPSFYDKQACILRSLAVKSVINEIHPGHNVAFSINSVEGYFPMSFERKADLRDEVKEIQPGEISVTPIKGDSILKAANSDTVMFKRGERKFFKYLFHKTCD